MSVPARRLDMPVPAPERRAARAEPARRNVRVEPRRRSAPVPRRVASSHGPRERNARRERPRPHRGWLGFAVLASAIVGSMVFGIVVLNVLLAQAAFRIDDAERRTEELTQERLELVREQATLSAPARISAWASRHGMRLPDDIRILHAPGGTADPAGADLSSSDPSAEDA